jgi:cytochrome c oxidase subunit IV
MTTAAEHVEHSEHSETDAHAVDHEHKSNSYYIKVAAILAAITGLEVALSYGHVGKLFMPALLIMMTVKFLMVVSLFMHLKFDHKMFSMLFYAGLILAILVYVAALLTFRFFDGP